MYCLEPVSPQSGGSVSAPLTEAELAAFQQRLLPLLARQVSLYTMGDSSLPEEQAQELMASLCCTLGADSPARMRALLSCADWEAELTSGRRRLERQVHCGKALWQYLCCHLPPVTNDAMLDSLKGIGQFFRLYDIRYSAHRVAVPILIDYPLADPVPESLQGVWYINEWLRRFALEACLLRLYPAAELAQLERAACAGWKTLPVSLYLPAADNALGRGLAGLSPDSLAISEPDRARIAALLEPLPPQQMQAALYRAAAQLCRVPALRCKAQLRYLSLLARQTCLRIAVALPNGHLDGIFYQFSLDKRTVVR